jgi:hypothetical protein
MNTGALNHILKKMGNEDLVRDIVTRLSPSEISTLLLAIGREMTDHIAPQDILKRYGTNRFAKPSNLDPVKVKLTEVKMLKAARALGFSPVLLSPASPLGSCSVTAKVHWIIGVSKEEWRNPGIDARIFFCRIFDGCEAGLPFFVSILHYFTLTIDIYFLFAIIIIEFIIRGRTI